jgi:NADPH:quinone reductase-like Zn-dependent oxidoreductase
MKAIRFHDYGNPDVLRLEDAPTPAPGPGEVLVKVHATSVNPVDCAIRAGYLRALRDYPRPFILGWDFSGTIAALGDGVTEWHLGDEVYGHPPLSGAGAYAEYIAVPASICARKPASIDHNQAASIPLVALTAWQALFDHAQLTAGQTVLIQRGAGGVGSFAIQFAKLKGARVIATASARNLSLLRDLGADEALDYNAVRFEDVVSNIDVVLEGMAGEVRERSWKTLKPGGILIALTGAPPTDVMAAERGFTQKTIWVHPDQTQLTTIAGLVDSGKVRAIVETVVPLAEAAQAHRMVETGHTRGKIVLEVA